MISASLGPDRGRALRGYLPDHQIFFGLFVFGLGLRSRGYVVGRDARLVHGVRGGAFAEQIGRGSQLGIDHTSEGIERLRAAQSRAVDPKRGRAVGAHFGGERDVALDFVARFPAIQRAAARPPGRARRAPPTP